jgi:Flp pilus assembly protein TadG
MQGKRERLGPGLLKVSLRADKVFKALIYVTATLPIVAGFSLLAIDASRAYIQKSSLHQGADTMAQAMAGEPDHTNEANNPPYPVMANDIEVTSNQASYEAVVQALKRANTMTGYQYTAMGSAGHIAGSIPTATAGLQSVTHEPRFLSGLVNVNEVSLSVSVTSTVTSEDLKATWISS